MPTPADPRVLFAAERTLLAWQRSCLTLMGFGFLIERFGLFVRFLHAQGQPAAAPGTGWAHLIGLGFILVATALAVLASIQHRRLLRTISHSDVPDRYWLSLAPAMMWLTALLGGVVAIYLIAQT
jgi:putative membrane protein